MSAMKQLFVLLQVGLPLLLLIAVYILYTLYKARQERELVRRLKQSAGKEHALLEMDRAIATSKAEADLARRHSIRRL